jgi:hypothetical protein
MLLEHRTVSRKTSGDGRLEITNAAAATCGNLGSTFQVELEGERESASLGTMGCTCRGSDKPHVHYFIESTLLKRLAAGREIDLDLDAAGKTIRVLISE